MTKPVIKIENLSKKYIIPSGKNASYGSLRDAIASWFSKPTDTNAEGRDVFWALRDLNLSIDKGEVLGIVGKNGSGKSTLLKLISSIIEPTSGSVEVSGRISSLIEVGAGFHPELTGRENTYFNGAILGMTTREIDDKLEEILAFSEIGSFFDVPVKFYSSGMYVRLAFSVAIHVDPDILIVDEVLSVGDFEFQKKCQNKIREFVDQGKTVLLVSHSMEAIESLCNRALLLDKGKLVVDGETHEVIQNYTGRALKEPGYFTSLKAKGGKEKIKVKSLELLSKDGKRTKFLNYLEPLHVIATIKGDGAKLKNLRIDVNIIGSTSNTWLASYTNAPNYVDIDDSKFSVRISKLGLSPGLYKANFSVHTDKDELQQWIPDAISFEVIDTDSKVQTGAQENIYLDIIEISKI